MQVFLLCYCAIIASIAETCVAQTAHTEQENQKSLLNFSRKEIVAFSITAHTIGATILLYEWWWKDDYHHFSFGKEGFFDDYSLGVDKIGHFYTSYFYTKALYQIFKWADYDDTSLMLWSVAIPVAYALGWEIGDGFSHYAFSIEDLASNYLGTGYALLQLKYPVLDNFKFKWSYVPTGKKYPNGWQLASDYDGHIYWLSISTHFFLPKNLQTDYTKYLNIAFGYGLKNYDGYSGVKTNNVLRKFAVSLDLNLSAIETGSDSWNAFIHIIDNFHFPAPGIKKTENQPAEFKPLLIN